jgi:glucan phosphoethanolaminetransferase (alkaline phosphatase superfamily)
MISLASPLILGILFKIMYWPGAGFLIIVGSSILLLGSIGFLIYTITNKRNIPLGALYFAIGLSGLFFCFKFMRWPGATFLIIPASISIIVSLIVLIKTQVKIEVSKIVSLIVLSLVIILFITSDSKLYSFRHINSTITELNYPEHYYTYAWILYKEGDKNLAKNNLELAIQEAKNPYNTQQKNLDSKLAIERYERAMDLLISNRWNEKERPTY